MNIFEIIAIIITVIVGLLIAPFTTLAFIFLLAKWKIAGFICLAIAIWRILIKGIKILENYE